MLFLRSCVQEVLVLKVFIVGVDVVAARVSDGGVVVVSLTIISGKSTENGQNFSRPARR